MKKQDLFGIASLMLLLLALYHPLFYTDYLYTDEAVQLWMYQQEPGFRMFTQQGRYLTEKLFEAWFANISTIAEIKYVRLFSLAGWLLSIPVWYTVIHRVVAKENLPGPLPFFVTLYLVTAPQLSIYVSWASCLELFLANTGGLVSGFLAYRIFSNPAKTSARFLLYAGTLFFGLVSLFSYQNGFGCFMIPAVMMLAARPQAIRPLVFAIVLYAGVYLVYFLLFRLQLAALDISTNERTRLFIAPWGKLKFLFTRPLSSSFHFNMLFNEKSIPHFIVYTFLFGSWLAATLFRYRAWPLLHRLRFLAVVCMLFALIYLPSLVTRENYASNRTLLALNLAVFILVAETVIYFLKPRYRSIAAVVTTIFFIVNAWYNFQSLFLRPVRAEYTALRQVISDQYKTQHSTVYFIRPEEDFFVRKYGITRSWDEFGVPSSFFSWVPEYLVKQVVFENTGNRTQAASIQVKHWLGREAFLQSGEQPADSVLLIDAEKVLSH